jgi:hypothetical protein
MTLSVRILTIVLILAATAFEASSRAPYGVAVANLR